MNMDFHTIHPRWPNLFAVQPNQHLRGHVFLILVEQLPALPSRSEERLLNKRKAALARTEKVVLKSSINFKVAKLFSPNLIP